MANPYRDVVNGIITDITTDVTGASNWVFHRTDPPTLAGTGQHCAVFFRGEEMDPQSNDTGHADYTGEYHLLYWEPAPEQGRQAVYEDAHLAVEVIYDDVMESLHSLQVTNTVYQLWPMSTRIFGPREEAGVRGFEVLLAGRRIRVWG